MNREEVIAHIRAAILKSSGTEVADISEDDTLGSYGLDDLDSVEMILTLEEMLDIDIPAHELAAEASDTVRNVIDAVLKQK